MEKLLLDAMALDCKFIVKYVDSSNSNIYWSNPLFLSSSRIKEVLDDPSIAEVHIIITPGY